MIRLNLLPPELKKSRKSLILFVSSLAPTVPIFSICLYVAGGLLALHSLLFLVFLGWSLSLRGLKARWESVAQKRGVVSELTERYAGLSEKEKMLLQLTGQRPLWAKKLKGLSDSMVNGVWLRSMSLGERGSYGSLPVTSRKVLILEGTSASLRAEEPAMIGRFIRRLKESVYFISDFGEMELESMKRRSIQETEVMDFKILCVFREREGL